MLKMEESVKINSSGLSQLDSVAQAILDFSDSKIYLFIGEMGSGKTTLIRAICNQLKVEDNVASPTFSLVNEYKSSSGPVYHFDFYRLDSLDEALDAGIEDYFFSGDYCLIEWPELVEAILPSAYIKVEIENIDKEKRNYKLTTHESD